MKNPPLCLSLSLFSHPPSTHTHSVHHPTANAVDSEGHLQFTMRLEIKKHVFSSCVCCRLLGMKGKQTQRQEEAKIKNKKKHVMLRS